MKSSIFKKIIFVFAVTVVAHPVFMCGKAIAAENIEYVKGKVLKVRQRVYPGHRGVEKVTVELSGGNHNGVLVQVDNYLWKESGYNTKVDTGDSVVVRLVEYPDGSIQAMISGYYRAPVLYVVFISFTVLFLSVMGLKKIPVFLTLLMNGVIVFLLTVLLKRGYPPVLSALLLAGGGITITAAIITGTGKRLVAVIIGAGAGVLAAGIIADIFMGYMHISGFFAPEARMILIATRYLSDWNITDLRGLVAAGIIIAALGAVIDIAVSIVSACWEVKVFSGRSEVKLMWDTGMAVGRDITGTMINSIILVFVAVSLPVILVFLSMGIPFIKAINFEFFSIMVLSAFTSSTALVITVPVSAFFASRIFAR